MRDCQDNPAISTMLRRRDLSQAESVRRLLRIDPRIMQTHLHAVMTYFSNYNDYAGIAQTKAVFFQNLTEKQHSHTVELDLAFNHGLVQLTWLRGAHPAIYARAPARIT